MKQTSSRTMRYASKILNDSYGFMLQREYEVVSIDEFELGWQALLKKQRVFARIINSRGEEEILFQTGLQPPDEFFDIGSVIYAATGEKVPPWKSSNPKVIQQYLDRIESYLEAEYGKGPDGLRAAQKEYSAAYSQPEIVFPQQDAAGSPPEQK